MNRAQMRDLLSDVEAEIQSRQEQLDNLFVQRDALGALLGRRSSNPLPTTRVHKRTRKLGLRDALRSAVAEHAVEVGNRFTSPMICDWLGNEWPEKSVSATVSWLCAEGELADSGEMVPATGVGKSRGYTLWMVPPIRGSVVHPENGTLPLRVEVPPVTPKVRTPKTPTTRDEVVKFCQRQGFHIRTNNGHIKITVPGENRPIVFSTSYRTEGIERMDVKKAVDALKRQGQLK